MSEKQYICIDLKSFYASVECVERGLDPMTTNLVVADVERTNKTICLAITPAMKALGIHNRCRVFEIPPGVEYLTAPPRMQLYIDYAAEIYSIYLKYISKDDIQVYSIDEAFMDVTDYLIMYKMSAKDLGKMIMDDIFEHTGIRATCGVGTNLYLTKIALDVTAKHSPDFIGVLDEKSYKEKLWKHKPLTDFWRIGPGTANRLSRLGIDTMEGIAKADEDALYNLFGKDAELLIDHAYGREPVTIADIKAYKPKTNCLTSGQVLMRDYGFEEGKIIVREMMDSLCLDMVDKRFITNSVTMYIRYTKGANEPTVNGTAGLDSQTSSDKVIIPAVLKLYDEIVDRDIPIRKISITCNNVVPEECRQYSFFEATDDYNKNHKLQQTVNSLKKQFGKDIILKGLSLRQESTAKERNHQIGGHKSGT